MSASPTDQPTNIFTNTDYISIRVNIGHGSFPIIKDRVLFDCDYVCYPHFGESRDNLHWHLFIPIRGEDSRASCERFRNRIRRGLNLDGNAMYSLKYQRSHIKSLTNAITYGKRELTEPQVSCDALRELVEAAPDWVDHGHVRGGQTMLPFQEEKPEKVRDWQLTYSNIVPQAIKHAQKHSLTTNFKGVIKHMMDNTKWKPSVQIYSRGVPPAMVEDFDVRSGRKSDRDMSFLDWKERF